MESSTVAWSALRTTKNTARSWFCRTLGKPTLLFPSYIPSCSNHAALAATKSERFTFASEGKAEMLHVHTLPRMSAGSLGEIFSWQFPLAHAENCLSLLPCRQNRLRGEDGRDALSPECPHACFLHQPAGTAESPNSAARVPQMTPFEA